MKYIWLILCFVNLFFIIEAIVIGKYGLSIAPIIALILCFTSYLRTPKGY